MKSKILSLLIISIFFSACLTSSSEVISRGDLVPFEKEFFQLSVPQNWESLQDDKIKNSPSGTEVVFRSKQIIDGVFPNISIVKENITTNESLIFAQNNIEKIPFLIKNMQTISQNEMEINNEKTILFIFTGRLDATEDDLRFMQIFFAKNNIGITLTAALPLNADNDLTKLINDVFASFIFK